MLQSFDSSGLSTAEVPLWHLAAFHLQKSPLKRTCNLRQELCFGSLSSRHASTELLGSIRVEQHTGTCLRRGFQRPLAVCKGYLVVLRIGFPMVVLCSRLYVHVGAGLLISSIACLVPHSVPPKAIETVSAKVHESQSTAISQPLIHDTWFPTKHALSQLNPPQRYTGIAAISSKLKPYPPNCFMDTRNTPPMGLNIPTDSWRSPKVGTTATPFSL